MHSVYVNCTLLCIVYVYYRSDHERVLTIFNVHIEFMRIPILLNFLIFGFAMPDILIFFLFFFFLRIWYWRMRKQALTQQMNEK